MKPKKPNNAYRTVTPYARKPKSLKRRNLIREFMDDVLRMVPNPYDFI